MAKCENCYYRKICINGANYAENCRHYKDKSLIVEMPCRVGDVVYIHHGLPFYEITQVTIIRIDIRKKFTRVRFSDGSDFIAWDNDWGIYKDAVFSSREEAERAFRKSEK